MANRTFSALRRSALAAVPLALALTLAACGDSNDNSRPIVVPTPTPTGTPTPSPTATPTPTSRNVSACLDQTIPGTSFTPTTLVIPDTLKLDLSRPAGFPNGRQFNDPVIDVTLAVLLLNLTRHDPGLLASFPLNPRADSTLLDAFPFLAPANGGQPGPGTATTFNFRTDPASAYVRVDRMGQPAVATALIGSTRKEAYNDANPSDDVAGTFVNGPDGIVEQLTELHNALADDLIAAGLTPCST